MFENIFETVIKGSNTVFLDINEEDYYLNYDTINEKAAEEITNNYFKMKQKDSLPTVKDITRDSFTHTIKITIEVDPKKHLEAYNIPDCLNITRNQ